jgi:hypothetical protein
MDPRANSAPEEDPKTERSCEPPRRGGGLHHKTLTETIRKDIEP